MKGARHQVLDSTAAASAARCAARRSALERHHARRQQITVRFREATNRDKARRSSRRLIRICRSCARSKAARYLLLGTLKQTAQKRIQEFAIQQNLTTLRNRVNELGVAEPIVQQAGADRIVVSCPAYRTRRRPRTSRPHGTLEVRMVDEEHSDLRLAAECARADRCRSATSCS
jgi:preprotein translocase subunit SecD